jgi:alginate O-acetyltransferase complex protein AlgI
MSDAMPSWKLMWLVAAAIYAGCKVLTWKTARIPQTPVWKQTAYLLGWPGMDAARFLGNTTAPNCSNESQAAAIKVAVGAVLLFGIARMIPSHLEYLAGWIGMLGMILILHFGLFHLLSCFLVNSRLRCPAFDESSYRSASLCEFWGVRCNTAFLDLTHRFLFRPLASRIGPRFGLIA